MPNNNGPSLADNKLTDIEAGIELVAESTERTSRLTEEQIKRLDRMQSIIRYTEKTANGITQLNTSVAQLKDLINVNKRTGPDAESTKSDGRTSDGTRTQTKSGTSAGTDPADTKKSKVQRKKSGTESPISSGTKSESHLTKGAVQAGQAATSEAVSALELEKIPFFSAMKSLAGGVAKETGSMFKRKPVDDESKQQGIVSKLFGKQEKSDDKKAKVSSVRDRKMFKLLDQISDHTGTLALIAKFNLFKSILSGLGTLAAAVFSLPQMLLSGLMSGLSNLLSGIGNSIAAALGMKGLKDALGKAGKTGTTTGKTGTGKSGKTTQQKPAAGTQQKVPGDGKPDPKNKTADPKKPEPKAGTQQKVPADPKQPKPDTNGSKFEKMPKDVKPDAPKPSAMQKVKAGGGKALDVAKAGGSKFMKLGGTVAAQAAKKGVALIPGIGTAIAAGFMAKDMYDVAKTGMLGDTAKDIADAVGNVADDLGTAVESGYNKLADALGGWFKAKDIKPDEAPIYTEIQELDHQRQAIRQEQRELDNAAKQATIEQRAATVAVSNSTQVNNTTVQTRPVSFGGDRDPWVLSPDY